MIQTLQHLDLRGIEDGETIRWERRPDASPIMAIAGVPLHSDAASIVDLTDAARCLGWRLAQIERQPGGRCCLHLRRPRFD